MKIARCTVSLEFLKQALHLPYDAEIRFVRMAENGYGDSAELVVTHDALADVQLAEGEAPPLVTPILRKNQPVEFVEWRQA